MKDNAENNTPILKVEDLVVGYRKKDILFGASLHAQNGEIVALIGANGSGKSTLLKAVGGLVKPKDGKVLYQGKDVTGIPPNELVHMGIGFLMQGGNIFPSLTVTEHFQLAVSAIAKAKFEDRVRVVWDSFPVLADARNRRAGLLSGGERQMLAFSMMLIQRSKVWLLDEPTSGLNPQMALMMIETIRMLSSSEGVTVLIVEQNLKEALSVSDRVYVLKNGATLAHSRPEEILDQDRLEEIFF
jgi:ABC-type branched-subunit amino acid transport system ATPase component